MALPITQAIRIRGHIDAGVCPECGGYLGFKETKRYNRKFIGHRDKHLYRECIWLMDVPSRAVSVKREQELVDTLKRIDNMY